MKIDRATPSPHQTTTAAHADQARKAQRAGKAYAQSAAAPAMSPGADRVEVSEAGRVTQVAADALKNTPPIRAEKVAELKARIQAGTYQVSGEAIAERMLADDVLD
jgi:negative regulator of flagellin synthesis FlgM